MSLLLGNLGPTTGAWKRGPAHLCWAEAIVVCTWPKALVAFIVGFHSIVITIDCLLSLLDMGRIDMIAEVMCRGKLIPRMGRTMLLRHGNLPDGLVRVTVAHNHTCQALPSYPLGALYGRGLYRYAPFLPDAWRCMTVSSVAARVADFGSSGFSWTLTVTRC